MKYHIQAAFYQRGVMAVTGIYVNQFIFIAVEKDNEYLNPVNYLADENLLRVADAEISENLRKFAECKRSNVWPGYTNELMVLTAPNWAVK
jgi:exodeoxyribonuclease VIII